MACQQLCVENLDKVRLCRVCLVVKQIYKVDIVESTVVDCNKPHTNNVLDQSAGVHSLTANGSKDKPRSTSDCAPPEDLLTATLLFSGDVSMEEINKAKNFARIHLLPSSNYSRSSHHLENQQEFNMVLESSPDIQAATSALMSFDPQYFEVTIEGSPNSVAVARSSIVDILENNRDSSRIDNNISLSGDNNKFYKSLLLDNFFDNQYKNSSTEMCHLPTSKPESTEIINTKNEDKSNKNCVRSNDIDQNRGNNKSEQNLIELHKQKIQLHTDNIDTDGSQKIQLEVHTDNIDSDGSHSPITSITMKSDLWEQHSLLSSDCDSSCEDSILTDPRYSKKIEQCLKLGYNEKQVTQVLAKHGPDCAINDLLSELIKLGVSDGDFSVGQCLSHEPESSFLNNITEFVYEGSHRLHPASLESGDSSGFSSSANSSNNSHPDTTDSNNLRHIIIDGSNVAMIHGKRFFSCKGIKIVVNWFKERGHKHITAFVPQWRKETSRPDAPIKDQEILSELEKEDIVVFTPSRRVKGRRMVCNDDRYILRLAVETDGIVVSNDFYRDLIIEREDFRQVVEQRLLLYSFVNDRFMPPEDPLGRLGPSLDNFLRKVSIEPTPKPQDCPYGKKCTYGNKCRFYHPERGFASQKLVIDTLKEKAEIKLQERAVRLSEIADKGKKSKQKLSRTKSLIPWDPILPNSQASAVKSQQEKPKLAHSKSLVLPNKSSDYLNESRKKLEEAELTAAMEKMSNITPGQRPLAQTYNETDSESKVKSPSQRTSPVFKKEKLKQTSSGDILSKTSFNVKSTSTSCPLTSPSHLTVPKPESPEGYLSGHLYLAKKLSDESIESNFFSEHTSSPSSTRTTSPVVSLNNTSELPKTKKKHIDKNGPFTSPPPYHPSLLYQQTSQPGSVPMDNIPNLSIFSQGIPYFPQRGNSSDICPTYTQEIMADIHSGHMLQTMNPISPESGPPALTDPFPRGGQSIQQLPNPYTCVRPEESHQSSEHQNLRRAFSSSGSVNTSEDLHEKLTRRSSGVSPVYGRGDYFMINENCMPAVDKTNLYHLNQSSSMNRQNSRSDPQMQATNTEELQDVLSPLFPLGNSGKRYVDRQFSNNYQYYQPNIPEASQLSKPRMASYADSTAPSSLGHRLSTGGMAHSQYMQCGETTHSQYVQHENPLAAAHMSHYQPTPTHNNRMFSSSYPHSCYPSQQLRPHQAAMMYPTQLSPPSPQTMFSTVRRESYPSTNTFPVSQHANIVYHRQASTCNMPHASSPMFVLEDAPFDVNNPRYVIYYLLSQLFPEQYVRRVMNQNPTVCDPGVLAPLIVEYMKQVEQ